MEHGDLPAVVSVHREAFPNFFLSFLGPRFLCEFYAALVDAPDGIVLVATDDGAVCGFVAGTVRPRAFYRRLFRRRSFRIALALVPAMLRRPGTLARVARRARQRAMGEPDGGGAELMSMAVAPSGQRRGVGRALVDAFASRLREARVRSLWLTTDAVDNDGVRQFYEGLGFERARRFTNTEGRQLEEYRRATDPAPRFIPFARPDIGPEEIEAVRQVLESGWLTTGERVQEFERQFAAAVGAKHAMAVNSGTAALHLALDAVGLGEHDEVIVPAYTFTATAEVVRYFGAKPVFVDVEPRTLNVDPAAIERAITPRTKAIMPVHFAGLAADLDAIRAIARRAGSVVIEDAAHAFPTRYRNRLVGSISDVTCFSFYATKTITTGEGGMICTDNDAWAERCRIMSLHGINHDAWKRYRAEGSWFYEVVAPGYKYNLTDIAAALGLAQLARAGRMRARRQEIAERYNAAFGGCFEPPAFDVASDHAWQLYPLRLHLDRLSVDRAKFIGELLTRGIGASVHFIPLHLQPYYRERYGFVPEDFPVSYREYQREVSLPIYSAMSNADVAAVITGVAEIAARFAT